MYKEFSHVSKAIYQTIYAFTPMGGEIYLAS